MLFTTKKSMLQEDLKIQSRLTLFSPKSGLLTCCRGVGGGVKLTTPLYNLQKMANFQKFNHVLQNLVIKIKCAKRKLRKIQQIVHF